MDKISFKKRYRKHPFLKHRTMVYWNVFANGIKFDAYSIEERQDMDGFFYVMKKDGLTIELFTEKCHWFEKLIDAKKQLLQYIYYGPLK